MVVEATTNMSRPRYRRWACFMLLWRTQNDFSGGANPYFAGSEWRSREAGSAPTPLPISSALSVTWPCNWNCCFVFTVEIASTHNKEQCNIHPEGMGGLESFCTLSLALPTSRLLMLLRRGLEKLISAPNLWCAQYNQSDNFLEILQQNQPPNNINQIVYCFWEEGNFAWG
jgi:hypothetical protein